MASYDSSMQMLHRKHSTGVSLRWVGIATLGIALLPGLSQRAHPQTPPEEAAEEESAPGYLIGPADLLLINVWKEPDLTVEAAVRFDGVVTCPLIGDVQAADLLPTELAESIRTKLQRFVENPLVTVAVSEANSARFYVLGQVSKSGEYPLSGRTTVIQGLALAGGFKDFAKKGSIVIVREDQTLVKVDYEKIADGKDTGQNIVLGRGDTIVVP
jgi:polysaccharide export outer membrane protein